MLKANAYHQSVRTVDFDALYAAGYRGILFDIDNTLVPHGAGATPEVINFLRRLLTKGFRIGLISNNDEERVLRFNRDLGLPYLAKAGKPKRRGFLALVRRLGLKPDAVIFVGDQIFTDIAGAGRAGLYTILVQPMDRDEPLQIVLKRKIEKLILRNRRFI